MEWLDSDGLIVVDWNLLGVVLFEQTWQRRRIKSYLLKNLQRKTFTWVYCTTKNWLNIILLE